MDVGTLQSYWQAHMDMLSPQPTLKLYSRDWIIHTRTEERAPARLPASATVYASMICDGCYIGADTRIESSVLSPGVVVRPGAIVRESILLTDCVVESGCVIERAVLDKRVTIGANWTSRGSCMPGVTAMRAASSTSCCPLHHHQDLVVLCEGPLHAVYRKGEDPYINSEP